MARAVSVSVSVSVMGQSPLVVVKVVEGSEGM